MRSMLQAVLVGEAPPPGGCGPLGAFDGDPGACLAGHAEIPLARLLAGVERVNLLGEPGAGLASRWPADLAVAAATSMFCGDAGTPALSGRTVLLAGRRVLRAFAAAVGFPAALPALCRLEYRGATWVPLPRPSGPCRWWNDPALRVAAGAVVRDEVLRWEAARDSWCTFGEEVLEGNWGGCFAFRLADGDLRWLVEPTPAAWDAGTPVEPGTPAASQVVEALVRAVCRVPRWGASCGCSGGAHSRRVGHLAAVAAPEFGADPDVALRLGGGHDLHEGLPGVGDVPSPTKRWLARTSPLHGLHKQAEHLVLGLAGLGDVGEAEHRAVAWADRAAMAVERVRDEPSRQRDYERFTDDVREDDADGASDLAWLLAGGVSQSGRAIAETVVRMARECGALP